MIINIEKTIIRKKLYSLYKAIILILVIIIVQLTPIFYNDFYGINKNEFSLILASLYLISIIFNAIREYNYIYFSNEGDKIILRYFAPNFFTSKKNSIEILKNEYAGFKVIKSFIGIKEKIILTQKSKKGVANYPPVSITALTKEERKKLLVALEKSILK